MVFQSNYKKHNYYQIIINIYIVWYGTLEGGNKQDMEKKTSTSFSFVKIRVQRSSTAWWIYEKFFFYNLTYGVEKDGVFIWLFFFNFLRKENSFKTVSGEVNNASFEYREGYLASLVLYKRERVRFSVRPLKKKIGLLILKFWLKKRA